MLEAEIVVLRQRVIVLRRGKPNRWAADKLVLGWLLLALEVERPPAGPSGRASGGPPIDPRDERCQSAMGSAPDSRRTAQARDRYWADQRGQIHDAQAWTSATRSI